MHARSAELRERLRRIRQDLGRQHEPLPNDSADAAIAVENDEVLHALEEAARRELAQIEHAFARDEVGEFGICECCGERIDVRRLQVVPTTALCTECAQRVEP